MVSTALGDRISKHPAYFAISHLPTGFWMLSSVADLLAIASGRNRFVRVARLLQAAGVAGAVGLHLLRPAGRPPANATMEQKDVAHLHDWVNNALPVVFGASAGLRSGPALERRRPPVVAVLLTLLGVGGLFLSRALAKRRGGSGEAAEAPRDEFVPVATRGDIAPGTMKMVEVDNHTLALANVDGTVFAFSNVCPHRSGPLAEGSLTGEMVTCPWHASSFNVRTGAVSGGPAREGIPTYDVRLDGDRILVRRP